MNKSFESQTDENELSKEDLALINTFTQKEMTKDDIFSFCVILCDNEIDRDYERFTEDSLHKLADFFIGKTAIRDHSMKSSDQSARTYKTEVIKDSTRKNSLGEDYVYLKAWCYMPRIKKNEELIEEIKAGIIKEVSVGCAVKSCICSVCGKELGKSECSHVRGGVYDGRLCYGELQNPTDAYEWSFVAVPAQKNAGITKKFGFTADGDANRQLTFLKSENERLKGLAKAGQLYRTEKQTELIKAFVAAFPSLGDKLCEKMAECLETDELCAAAKAVNKNNFTLSSPQLTPAKKAEANSNSQFRL